MHNVLFLSGQSAQVAEIVQGYALEGFELAVHPGNISEEEKKALIRDTEFLLLHPADISASVLQAARKLKHIQLLTAGYDKVDLRAARELGITVSTNGGTNAWAVAEHTIALLLALYKKLLQCDQSVRAGTWRKPVSGDNTFEVAGKTVGLIGVGNIGSKVAKRLKAFETEILFCDRGSANGDEFGGTRVDLKTLLSQSDIISFHVPLTEATRGMIGAAELGMMKRSAVLLNTSRAELVDEEALEIALHEGWIAGAGLDVFYEEPVPANCGLLELDNVVLTPHTAGHSHEGWFRRARFAWENIQRVAAGEQATSQV